MGAYALLGLSLAFAVIGARSKGLVAPAKGLAIVLAGLVVLQAGFGIATLMAQVPVWMGVVHQTGAALVLAAAVVLAWRAQRA
jgi:cytochrome c oxidase assembly protein subunit 15